MKKNLVLTILICALAAFSSEVKFALLGLDDAGKNAVELVQSQLFGQAEFVERSDIGAIHQEHFLLQQFGTAKLARQFTGADIFIAVQKNILTAFETRCGFRLAYRKLSSDNSASAEIKAEILKWKHSGKDFFKHRIISFAGIRNNLHSSLASEAETYSRAINLAVNQTPAILLERDIWSNCCWNRIFLPDGRRRSAVRKSSILNSIPAEMPKKSSLPFMPLMPGIKRFSKKKLSICKVFCKH